MDDLRGVWRVGRALATGALPLDRLRRPFGDDPRDREVAGVPNGLARQLAGFCVVGALSTLVYLALYSLLRLGVGPQVANALALLISAIANTAANRRLTFGVRGRARVVRHQAQGLVVFAIGLALTSGSLAALEVADPDPSHSTELAVLVAANLAATVLRFLLFRAWVFPERARTRSRTRQLNRNRSASRPVAREQPRAATGTTPRTTPPPPNGPPHEHTCPLAALRLPRPTSAARPPPRRPRWERPAYWALLC